MFTAAARKPRSRQRDPVEPEVDALDERVLRHDEPAGEPRRVVGDPGREAAPLELGEQPELAQLVRASRRSAIRAPPVERGRDRARASAS